MGDKPRASKGSRRGRGGGSTVSSQHVTWSRGSGRGRGGGIVPTQQVASFVMCGIVAEVRAIVAGNGTGSSSSSNMVVDALPSITTAQWQQLLDMLGYANEKSSNDRMIGKSSVFPWIIDIGVSSHIIGNLELLSQTWAYVSCAWNNSYKCLICGTIKLQFNFCDSSY